MSLELWLNYLGQMMQGAWVTVQLTAAGCALALLVAFVAGLARVSRWSLLRGVAQTYTEFFRGTSIFVQLFWAYFVLPLMGVPLSPMQCGILILGLNVGAYASEVVRGSIQAVPKDQTQAAIALNLTPWQRMRHVILPQAVVIMLPTFGNNAIELLKATAIVSLISLSDLTFTAQVVRLQTGNTLIPYGVTLLTYYLLSIGITRSIGRLERRMSAGLEGQRA